MILSKGCQTELVFADFLCSSDLFVCLFVCGIGSSWPQWIVLCRVYGLEGIIRHLDEFYNFLAGSPPCE